MPELSGLRVYPDMSAEPVGRATGGAAFARRSARPIFAIRVIRDTEANDQRTQLARGRKKGAMSAWQNTVTDNIPAQTAVQATKK
jgi:hypothetical protein